MSKRMKGKWRKAYGGWLRTFLHSEDGAPSVWAIIRSSDKEGFVGTLTLYMPTLLMGAYCTPNVVMDAHCNDENLRRLMGAVTGQARRVLAALRGTEE